MARGPSSSAEGPRHQRGNTHAQQPEAEDRSGHQMRQPNEHDTSADSQAGANAGAAAVGRQAHKDVTSGQQDTDKGPVADKVYHDHLRGDRGDGKR